MRICLSGSFDLLADALPAFLPAFLAEFLAELLPASVIRSVKVSGALAGAAAEWRVGDVLPFVRHAIDCFGFDRCMYGSDWTVSEQTHRYPIWVQILDEVTAGTTADEKRQLFRETAARIYRLS